jgi:cytochrome c-type biogenesis protein CcmH/NrfG
MKKIALLIVCLGFIPAVFRATPEPAPSEKEKEEVELPAPDLLKREQKGETLTPEMHFILGLDAYNTPEMRFILGTDAYDKGDLEEAAKHWEIAAISGKNPKAYLYWGDVLLDLDLMKNFRESCDKYAEAVRLKPDYHEAYSNWGTALSVVAKRKKDEALFRESFDKYAEAVRIEPDEPLYYRNWAVVLRWLAKITEDEAEREALLKQADEKEKTAGELEKASKDKPES